MEFSIPVGTFQNVVSKLGTILKLNADDVTSMMLVEVLEDRVNFCGTSGSVYAVITAKNCEITKKGKILIQLREISNYVAKFVPLVEGTGTDVFKIAADDKEGTIKTKTIFMVGKPSYRNLKFKSFSPSLLPKVKDFEDAQLIVNSDILLEGIGKTMPCIDPNEIRHALAGMYLTIDDNKITFVGTNGIKLSEAMLDIHADIKKFNCILKYSMVSAMRTLLDRSAQVFMKFETRDVYVKCNDVYITGQLILNENYPEYKNSLSNFTKVITIPRYNLVDSISAVSSVLDAEDNFRLSLTFENSSLILKNDKVDDVHEFEVPFEHNLSIDINGMFLLSVINNFVGEYLEVCFVDNTKPVIFRAKDNPYYTSLLTLLRRR